MAEKKRTVCDELLEKMDKIGDVTFLVGPDEEKVKAFVFLLRSLSPVFESMFDEKWKSSDVKVPDIEANIFRAFLKLLLTDDIKMSDLLNLGLLVQGTVELLYAANKYDVSKIQKICRRSLEENINVHNVVLAYEALKVMNEPQLEAIALKFLKKNVNELMAVASFSNLSAESLTLILSDDELAVDELSLFNGIYSWAEFKCKREEFQVTGENVRNFLGHLLFLVRFPLMTHNQFFRHVHPTGILSAEEIVGISQYIALKHEQDPPVFNTPFNTRQRLGYSQAENPEDGGQEMGVYGRLPTEYIFSYSTNEIEIDQLLLVVPNKLCTGRQLCLTTIDAERVFASPQNSLAEAGKTIFLFKSNHRLTNSYHSSFKFSHFQGFQERNLATLTGFIDDPDSGLTMRVDMIFKTSERNDLRANDVHLHGLRDYFSDEECFWYCPREETTLRRVEFQMSTASAIINLSDDNIEAIKPFIKGRAYGHLSVWIGEMNRPTGFLDEIKTFPISNTVETATVGFDLPNPLVMQAHQSYRFYYEFLGRWNSSFVSFAVERGTATFVLDGSFD